MVDGVYGMSLMRCGICDLEKENNGFGMVAFGTLDAGMEGANVVVDTKWCIVRSALPIEMNVKTKILKVLLSC